MTTHPFRQIDVFGSGPLLGNPVAVVHDADNLSDEQMAAFARWTNLSETTFLLAPTVPGADYRLRIFTPSRELPFAGHPTLGSAHAWLEAGGTPGSGDIVQECEVGRVTVRLTPLPDSGGQRLDFVAPPLIRSGPVSPDDVARIAGALAISASDIVDAAWVDNGPGWVGVLLRNGSAVLDLRPEFAAFGGLKIGVVGLWGDGSPGTTSGPGDALVEVRAFVPTLGIPEDPVTGSLNAGLGQWLAGTVLPNRYVASQGTALGKRGRVHVSRESDGTVWVGGEARTTIHGTVAV
jgi:PhzF family phenazine biosynthesis protein